MNPTLTLSLDCGDSSGFDEAVYRAWNPDVDAAIRAGSLESGRIHFEAFGRGERRPPYGRPAGSCGSPHLRAGDDLLQLVVPTGDWWAGVSFTVGTQRSMARLALEGAVLRADTGETLRTVRFEEWADDGETLVLKLPPIKASRGNAYLLRMTVRVIEAPGAVQLVCVPTAGDDGLRWNGAAPASMRAEVGLLYTPLTLAGPMGITLNPLTHCAGSCIHCLGRTAQKNPGSLKPEWIDALRVHFRDGPGVAWCTDYATDFFKVAQRRPELIDLLAAKGDVSINTEGQHVTADVLRRMLKGNVSKIGFSCDAATEETYAKIRMGLGKLETVLDSARLALRLRAESGQTARPCIAMSMVAMKANLPEVVAFVELAAKTGVDAVWFNQLWVCSEDMVEQSLMFCADAWHTQLAAARERGRELGIGVYSGIDIRPDFPQEGISWCPEPWSALIILGSGDVLACASPASKIGSLRDSTLEEIWNGEAFQQLRQRVNTERPPLICNHCFAYRKPGNADGVFTHHLLDGYDLRRDLTEEGYAEEYRKRFSFARAQPTKTEAGAARAVSG
ncbi:MAG: radical SAM protein [Verrucomicrobia bacterium]|nr:radical SAM protein [Verrucomicrobiota bacterium]